MGRRIKFKYAFDWRDGNRFELLVDGNHFYPVMLQAVTKARHSVWLEIYLCESGAVMNRFIDAFLAAVRRGADVRLLLDDFGSRGLSRYDRDRLRQGGVQLAFYNPLRLGQWLNNLARDHRKILLIDGETAFIGGAGFTDEFDPPAHGEQRWRETMIQAHGPVIADWQTLFIETWNRSGGEPLSPVAGRLRAAGDMPGQVTAGWGPGTQGVLRALIKHLRGAERRAWLCTGYFVPSWKLRRTLRRAARRGVDTRLLLPGPHTDHPAVRLAGRRFYSHLLRAGVRIFEYQPRVLHAKTALCDYWVSIGSSNFDRWNLRWNLEANQTVEHQGFSDSVRSMFEHDFTHSIEIRYESWERRPWYSRLWERFWGKVDIWLHRLGRGRKGG